MTADAHDVQIRLLGSVELAARDVLSGTKQRLLLGALAMRAGHVVRVDELTRVLWEDDRPDDPRGTLQVHVSKLRRALADAGVDASVEHRAGGYALELDPQILDVRQFEILVGQSRQLVDDDPTRARELVAQALALWRGQPFGELADRADFRGEIARLEDLHVQALEARIDADLAAGRAGQVIAELKQLTSEHPLRENLWARLMLALARENRYPDALAAYEQARRVLADELGVDPSAALQQLHTRILRRDPDLEPARSPAGEAGKDRPAEQRSLAVLPFDVIGGSDDTRLLAVGLHNDVLTELSRVPGLTVISRRSVLGYAETARTIPEIARELGTGTVLTGSLQSVGERFRLSVQLIDGRSDVSLWAASYDDELGTGKLLAIQRDLAREISGSLSAELGSSPRPAERQHPGTESLEAYRLVAAGRRQCDLRTDEGFRQAVDLFEDAARIDPQYADAWTALADALVGMEAYGHGQRHELLPRAEQAVHRALALDPASAEAHASLGILHTAYQNGPAAITELDRAIAIQPSYAAAHNWHCWACLLTGRADAGLTGAARTAELDPLAPEAHAHLALAHAAKGDPERGLEAARFARRLSPYTTAELYEGICLCELGRYEEARAVLSPLTVADRGEPGVPWTGRGPEATLAVALDGLAERDAARHLLDHVDSRAFPFAAGMIHLATGAVEDAARMFGLVDRLTAWPCLSLHHFHRDLWARIDGSGALRDLRRKAAHSWQMEPPRKRLESDR